MNKRISIIATTIALAVALAPAAAFADEAVSFNGEALGTDANKANAQTVYFAGSDWRVIGYGDSGIASADGTATLLAADFIGNTYFNEGDGPNPPTNHYKGSLLQDAVNGIANGIPEGEKAAIVPRTLEVSGYDDWNTSGVAGEQVEGAILWPLSTAEANSLDRSLASLGTEYSDYGKWWWLRSPGKYEEDVAAVGAVGNVGYLGHSANYKQYGVRPAFNLNLTSVLFSSAAEGGKFGGAAAGKFSALSGTSSVSAWKLTLKDSSRNIAASATGTTAAEGYSAWSVPVTFSGGGTGSSDYVSAILCDSDGNAIYYGTVANATASGTQDMDMPTGLAAGSYTLKVFSEQRNGDFKTDYAGPFVVIELAVEAAPAEHTVRFVDEDGTEISTATYAEGTVAADVVKPAEPTKPPTAQYTYEFAGWYPAVADVTGDATYTATYASTVRKYTVTWKDDDGSVIDEALVEYGAVPTHADPAKAATAQYTYEFAGWTPEIVAVTGDATYTATYEATPVPKPAEKATLTFDLAGGTLDGKTGSITIEANVGDTIKLPAAPKREGYTFKYWKGSQYAAGADYKVEGDHSFTAVWEKNATSDSGDSDKKSPLPATGDDNATALTLCALMALASLALLSGSAALRRRGAAYRGKHSAR